MSTSTKRCFLDVCRKKLMLSDFACKCGQTFCVNHRHSEAHSCSYDYKKAHTDVLLKTLSTCVVAKKVDII